MPRDDIHVNSKKRPRTRSAAVRHWHDLSLSAYERDLVTTEKVYFRSLDPNRTFEEFFLSLTFLVESCKSERVGVNTEVSLSNFATFKCHMYPCVYNK